MVGVPSADEPTCCGYLMAVDASPSEMPESSTGSGKRPFLDVLIGECRALSERFSLTSEQSEVFREFVTTTAMRSWRNGRAVGWNRTREGMEENRNRTHPSQEEDNQRISI